MSSRPCRTLFETTRSALRLQTDAKSSLDRNFWIMRELGNDLALAGLAAREPPPTLARPHPTR
jgi:hypothetical protein